MKIRSIHPSFFSDIAAFDAGDLDLQSWPKGGITPYYVYHLTASTGRCVYVGITWDPLTRLRSHRSKPWWPLVRTVRIAAVGSEQDARNLEKVLIARHRPIENRIRYDRERR